LLTSAERHQIGREWADTAREGAWRSRVHELFEAQALRTPGAVAVIQGEDRVSYRDLNARANRLARALLRAGVGPEARVGICLARSVDMVASLLAVWKAGAAYVPMDPTYPEERLAFMLADSGAEVLLADAEIPESLSSRVRRVIPPEQAGAEGG